MTDIQIGECPKCGKRTFVVYEHKEGKSVLTRPIGSPESIIKGKCYNCGKVREIEN